MITSGVLAIMHILSMIVIDKVLVKMMDSINIFKMSKSCFPAFFFKPILTRDEENHMEDISNFLKFPTKDNFKETNKRLKEKTGENMVDLVLRNDYHEVMQILLDDHYLPINSDMVKKVFKTGTPKMLKIVLAKKKEMIQGE